jgi:hypothetical protein
MVIIRNIKVDIDGKTSTHPDLHINILDQARRIPDAFMEAQVSKTRVFVGEGIDVNYYLYFKNSISANDVKDFPKLNKFIKRFHHINAPVETVQYHNQVLKRILAYSARIYPEKEGSAVIDPMKISVQIIENEFNSPFGGFGMGSQRMKNAELASKSITIEVLPLPSSNVPPGFTGLVGEHEFTLTPGKDKYLVNEPIELKLEVKGGGALEKFEAPVLYSDNGIEQFDTKGEVAEIGTNSAKKTFEYTYLARQPLSIKERDIILAYFDSTTGRYIEKKIKVPGIVVSGTSAMGNSSTPNIPNLNKNTTESKDLIKVSDDIFSKWFNRGSESLKAVEKNEIGLMAPDFRGKYNYKTQLIDILNILVGISIVIILALIYIGKKNSVNWIEGKHTEIKAHIISLKKNGINYSDLYQVISALDRQNQLSKGGVSVTQILDSSKLSPQSVAYFKNCLNVCEQKSYGKNISKNELVFEQKYFKELMKNL